MTGFDILVILAFVLGGIGVMVFMCCEKSLFTEEEMEKIIKEMLDSE